MGLLNSIFGKKEAKPEKVLPWIALENLSQLETISEASASKTQLVFKHSTRCGISKMVLNTFVDAYSFSETDFDLYYLDLLNHRDLSAEVGYKFQVIHESPQLIVIKDKKIAAHGSHGGINDIDLSQFI